MRKKKKRIEKELKLDGWVNPLTGQGIPGRDKHVSGYFTGCWNLFNWPELDALYRNSGISRRIIDVIAAEMIRQGWEVEGGDGDKATEYLNDIKAPMYLCDLIKWARLYGGALAVLGIMDGRPLNEPVDLRNIRAVKWIRIYDRFQIVVDPMYIAGDLNSDFYGYPEYYSINDYRTAQTFIVHHSRVLRMDWNQLPPRDREVNQGWGESVLQSTYDQLRNYGTTFSSIALLMQDFVNGVLKIPGLSNYLATQPCAKEDLYNRVNTANLTKSNLGMLVLDGEESFEKISSNLSGISDILDRFMLDLSAVTGIPFSLLFGRSPAGLNATGESDIRNFYDLVKQYQENKLRPCLEKLIRYVMLSLDGPYEGIEPKNWSLKFTPLWQNSEEQEATIRRTVAETDKIYIEMGVLDPDEVAISRFGGDQWSMNTLIDVKAREGGYSPEETVDLEYQKEKELEKEQDVTIGPDALPQENPVVIVR